MKEFLPRYRAFLEQVQRFPLTILVWGPAKDRSELYVKRVQMRDELCKRGHAAFFSEDLEQPEITNISQKGLEFLQALACDLIVVLNVSYGGMCQ